MWLFITFFELDCKIGNGETYRGKISITILGVTCQAWSAQSPHTHNSFTEETHGDKGLESNVRICDCFGKISKFDLCSWTCLLLVL